jgi:hypothetical protein
MKYALTVVCMFLKSAWQAVCRPFLGQFRRLSTLRSGSLRSALTALLLAPLAALHAAGPIPADTPTASSLQPVSRSEYITLFERALPDLSGNNGERHRQTMFGPLGKNSSTALRDRSIFAGLYLAMWRETKREELRLIGEPLFDFLVAKFLEPENKAALADPFTPIGIFGAGYALDREGKLTEARREQFHKLALLLQKQWGKMGTVGNWDTAVVTGQLYALKVFPADPDLAKLRKDVDDYCGDLFGTFRGDVEHAPYYGGLSATQIFQIAALSGNSEKMDTSFFRELYTRWAKLAPPHALMPSFGDNYFGEGYVTLQMYMFEAAARAFHDPRFLASSRLIYNRAIQPASRRIFTEWDATWMIALLSLPPYQDAPDPLPVFEQTTEVLHHFPNHHVSVHSHQTEPDKLLLKVPGSPRAPYAMLDLGTGGHGALECRGAVLHYEINGVPMCRGTQKNPYPSLANLVYLKPPGRQFPHMSGGFEEGKWHTQTIALEMLKVDFIPPFKFDAIVRGPTQHLYLDNFRLEGAGGTRMLEACESTGILAPWEHRGKPDAPAYELSDDRTEGRHSLRLPLVDGRHGHEITSLSGKSPFDRSKFDVLKFDWKYEGSEAHWIFARWSPDWIKGGRNDIFPWWEFYHGTVQSADAAGNAVGDAYGRVAFSSYVTPDTAWSRDLVLTREGILVIYDRVTPGPMAKDHTVGPLWQLDDVTHQGENWFAQPTMDWPSEIPSQPRPTASVLVWHAPMAGRKIGSQSTKESPGLFMKVPKPEHRPITTFAAETAVPGKTLAFVTVVAPWAEFENPAELAGGITAQFTTKNAEVRLIAGKVKLEIQFAADGSWLVERSNEPKAAYVPNR